MITTAQIIDEKEQTDGRKYITERHRTDDGKTIDVQYLANADLDPEQRMANRIFELEAQLEAEAAEKQAVAVAQKVEAKTTAYLKSLADNVLTESVGLSESELAHFKL